jgi:phosphoribosylanthranilate isomerase
MKTIVTCFLFDSKSELPGGTGISFNWKNLKKYNLKKGFLSVVV